MPTNSLIVTPPFATTIIAIAKSVHPIPGRHQHVEHVSRVTRKDHPLTHATTPTMPPEEPPGGEGGAMPATPAHDGRVRRLEMERHTDAAPQMPGAHWWCMRMSLQGEAVPSCGGRLAEGRGAMPEGQGPSSTHEAVPEGRKPP